jgi:hypothetical protein
VAIATAMQVLEFVNAAPDERLRGGFRVERAEETLEIAGWALGLGSPVARIEVVSSGQVVGQAMPSEERADIAQAFPAVAGAGSSGFRIALEASGRGKSRLKVRAVLEGGGLIPLGELRVETSR